jgi:glucose/mannose-6-phosphate isomerase
MVTISAGGKLMELAESKGISHVKIKMAEAPRFTLPYSLFASIAVLRSASLLEGFEWELDEAISNLKKTGRVIASGVDEAENPAKKLGAAIAMTDPCVYASSVTKSVAARFKTSINENAKMHAHWDYSPDLFHNEVEAWEYPAEQVSAVFLRRANEPPFEARSLDVFNSMLESKSVKTQRLDGKGEGNLSQLMTLCFTADFASYYAAIVRKVPPFPIRLIDELKRIR